MDTGLKACVNTKRADARCLRMRDVAEESGIYLLADHKHAKQFYRKKSILKTSAEPSGRSDRTVVRVDLIATGAVALEQLRPPAVRT